MARILLAKGNFGTVRGVEQGRSNERRAGPHPKRKTKNDATPPAGWSQALRCANSSTHPAAVAPTSLSSRVPPSCPAGSILHLLHFPDRRSGTLLDIASYYHDRSKRAPPQPLYPLHCLTAPQYQKNEKIELMLHFHRAIYHVIQTQV